MFVKFAQCSNLKCTRRAWRMIDIFNHHEVWSVCHWPSHNRVHHTYTTRLLSAVAIWSLAGAKSVPTNGRHTYDIGMNYFPEENTSFQFYYYYNFSPILLHKSIDCYRTFVIYNVQHKHVVRKQFVVFPCSFHSYHDINNQLTE